ncbi:glycoside hydrolase family 28 protein [Bacteroides sp. 214]|uniref:glycoside hydrolase family 28 protein n=1 Tax=Bacteroides sp. 214 TaxID=2302935 RepID=UPI0013D416BD|nr:glycoside hydrolase family 28 protein [Bacteroides sp. 214]NDW11404.1 glycoside hydrolase family 28 protein [Bacteroides sp. 214]
MKQLVNLSASLLLSVYILCGCAAEGEQDYTKLPWVKEVGAKTYPGSKQFAVTNYGAVNDSTVLSTEAIQAAIDACHENGGGMVTFEPGYYHTGALFIKSGVNLHIGEGVTLLGSRDINHYPESMTRIAGIEMVWPSAVLNILDAENAAISGKGTIDCRGEGFWEKYWTMRKDYEQRSLRWIVDYDCKRVRGILVSNSKDVTLRDFTLMRTGFWGIQLLYSSHCTADGLLINNNIGGHGPSTDGIDVDSSSYILIENCDIDCNDDNICLKAGRDADGLRVNRPTEYVVIRNCIARKGGGLMTCGSETSGGIYNILGYNLKSYGTSAVMRLKSAMTRGGVVENIYMTNVEADNARHVFVAELNWNPKYSYSELPAEYEGKEIPNHWKVMLTRVEPVEKGFPHFRNVYMSNVTATNIREFISAAGRDDSLRLINMELKDITVSCEKSGKVVFTDQFALKNIKLHSNSNDKILFRDNTNTTADIIYE